MPTPPTIEETTKKLTAMLAEIETSQIVNFSGGELLRLYQTGLGGSPLQSPFKQVFHLLGLMLVTPAQVPQPLAIERWKEILKCLNEITDAYSSMFFPKKGEIRTDEWRKAREVAMPVFLNYFNTLPLLYQEQLTGIGSSTAPRSLSNDRR